MRFLKVGVGRLFAVTAAFAIAITGLVLLPSAPAEAAGAYGCASGYTCAWKDPSYQTAGNNAAKISILNYDWDLSGNKYVNSSYSANNSISSLVNCGNTNTAYYFTGVNGTGSVYTRAPGGGAGSYNSNITSATYNDNISSIAFRAKP